MGNLTNAFDTLETTASALTDLNDCGLACALLCTLFDHVCESYNLDKKETLEKMVLTIGLANSELGNMY